MRLSHPFAAQALATTLDADDEDGLDRQIKDALNREGALLRSCAVFKCDIDGATFPLHHVGTTLGVAPGGGRSAPLADDQPSLKGLEEPMKTH